METNDRYISDLLSADFWNRIGTGDFCRNIYPVFADRKAWAEAMKSPYAAEIIKDADNVPEGHVPELLFSNYIQFNVNGNRSEFEAPYFERRFNIGKLVLAYCLTGDKEKYMPRLLDYVIATLEEWTWCCPAHIHWWIDEPSRWQFPDLFASETGAVMAQIFALIGDELEKECIGIKEWIRKQTLERTARNVIFGKDRIWWFEAERPANWTIWCSLNNLTAALLLETDLEKLKCEAEGLLGAISRFISYADDDGYCEEGPTYYAKSNSMIFRVLNLLNKVLPGCADSCIADPKIRRCLEFIECIRIGKNYQVSFADAQPWLVDIFGEIRSAGAMIGSEALLNFGAGKKAALGHCGDCLCESLMVLFDMPEISPDAEVEQKNSFFKDRLGVLKSERFAAAVKAGNNEEQHNHNDLGHFSVFFEGNPVIIDAGTGAYSKIHFSDKRYTLWNTRGNGHNAPVLNGCEEVYGGEYTASLDLQNDNRLVCDLSKAYPAEAGVKSVLRTLDFSPEQVVVEDKIVFCETAGCAELRLLTLAEVVLNSDGSIQLGDVRLTLEGLRFAGTEEMPEMLHSRTGKTLNIWGGKVTAFTLTAEADSYRMIFSC